MDLQVVNWKHSHEKNQEYKISKSLKSARSIINKIGGLFEGIFFLAQQYPDIGYLGKVYILEQDLCFPFGYKLLPKLVSRLGSICFESSQSFFQSKSELFNINSGFVAF